jgi:hypothetical protein
MSRKNILGLVIAVFFTLGCVLAALDGPWRDGFHVFLLWIACAFWRRGEGLEDSYNKQQCFIAGAVFGTLGFTALQPILEPLIDTEHGTLVFFYGTIMTLLFIRLTFYALRNGTYAMLMTLHPSQIGKFFLFQPPAQVREHTRG